MNAMTTPYLTGYKMADLAVSDGPKECATLYI